MDLIIIINNTCNLQWYCIEALPYYHMGMASGVCIQISTSVFIQVSGFKVSNPCYIQWTHIFCDRQNTFIAFTDCYYWPPRIMLFDHQGWCCLTTKDDVVWIINECHNYFEAVDVTCHNQYQASSSWHPVNPLWWV